LDMCDSSSLFRSVWNPLDPGPLLAPAILPVPYHFLARHFPYSDADTKKIPLMRRVFQGPALETFPPQPLSE